MTQGRFAATLAVGWLLLGSGWAAAQNSQQVTPTMILKYIPRQKDAVTVSTPTDAEAANCKVDVVKGANNTSAWVLKDGRGQILRRFADTKGTNKVDTFSFYLDGQEVYREINAKGGKNPDQYRWFGSQGMRWGFDFNDDGRIDGWKQISAEEVSQEIVRAVMTNDPARLQALAIREEELKSLQLPAAEATRLRDSLAQMPAKFQVAVRKLTNVNDKARWLHLETQPPQCEIGDAASGRPDLIRYKSGTIVYETKGNAELLQTGELIQVGLAWRLVSAPTPGGPAEPETVAGGAESTVFVNPQLKPLVDKLRDLDAAAPKPNAPQAAVVIFNLERAKLVQQIAQQLQGNPQAEQWWRQVADCLSAAAQASSPKETTAHVRLVELRDQIAKAQPNSTLAGYIAFREMSAEYAAQIANSPKPEELTKIQDNWRARLKKFVDDFPTAEDTPDAILQLAMESEFSSNENEAKNWYRMLVNKYREHPVAKKADGALRRLDLDGKPFELNATTLDNRALNIATLNGKVVVVYYWASWNQQCLADFGKLKALATAYGPKGLEIVGVNLDNTPALALAFLNQTQAPGRHVFEAPGGLDSPLAVQYGVIVVPNLILVDKHGKVASHTVQMSNLEDEIKKLTEK